MVLSIVVILCFALALPLYAIPVASTSSIDNHPYNVVAFGTNSILQLLPATNLPSPTPSPPNIEVISCAAGQVCIEEIFTSGSQVISSIVAQYSGKVITCAPEEICVEEIFIDSASQVVSSIVAEFSLSPAPTTTAPGNHISSTPSSPRQGEAPGSTSASEGSSSRSALLSRTPPISNATSAVVSNQGQRDGHRTSSGTLPITSATSTMISNQGQGDGNHIRSGTQSIKSATSAVVSNQRQRDGNRTTSGTPPIVSATSTMVSHQGQRNGIRTSSKTPSISSATSAVVSNQGQEDNSRSSSGTAIAPSATSSVPYAFQVTSSQDSIDSITTTETAVPAGVSIQTITTSTCSTAGAIITTTSSGSTVATEVPKLCINGFAFIIFGLDLPSLCHKLLKFPLGIVWRVLCSSGALPIISIISIDPEIFPPGGGPPDNPGNEKPTPTDVSSQRASSQAAPSQTTQSSVSSSAAAMPTRYLVMPKMNTAQSTTDSLFAKYSHLENITQAKRNDGSLEFFALELSDVEALAINDDPKFIIIQESVIDIEIPDTTDPDANQTNYVTEPLSFFPKVRRRKDVDDQISASKDGELLKRVRPQQTWAEKLTTWTLAMISLVPGIPLPVDEQGEPGYDHGGEGGNDYPYYYVDDIEPGDNVRVYLIDTGLNMLHPEFNGRLKPGITQGQTKDDWDIDWLFPRVDDNEWFYGRNIVGSRVRLPYEYNYIDPQTPNPDGGIHPAYTDFRLKQDRDRHAKLTPHGTRLSAFIIGDQLGQAQKARFTVVKLPQYINGPRAASGVLFPLFSAVDALNMIKQDILARKEEGEELFVISSSCGYVFGDHPGYNPFSAEENFEETWTEFLQWLDEEEVAICASAGNSRQEDPEISLIPARLFKSPEMVVGSVTPQAIPHPGSQGQIGDGILTAYAPAAGALVVSSDPDGVYIYEWFDPSWSAVTSYGTW